MWLAIAGFEYTPYDFIETFDTKEEAEKIIKKYFIEKDNHYSDMYDEYIMDKKLPDYNIRDFEARMNNCNDYDEFVKEFLEDLIDLEPIENYVNDERNFIIKEIHINE